MQTEKRLKQIRPELTKDEQIAKLTAANKRLSEKLHIFRVADRQKTARIHELKVQYMNLKEKINRAFEIAR